MQRTTPRVLVPTRKTHHDSGFSIPSSSTNGFSTTPFFHSTSTSMLDVTLPMNEGILSRWMVPTQDGHEKLSLGDPYRFPIQDTTSSWSFLTVFLSTFANVASLFSQKKLSSYFEQLCNLIDDFYQDGFVATMYHFIY